MNREEYVFAYNINGTGVSGIITMTNPPKLVCYCDEENSKTILKALNPSLPPAEGAEKLLTKEEYQKPENQNRDKAIIGYKSVDGSKQPTAEGAENFLKKYTIYCKNVISIEGKTWVLSTVIPQAMQEFATLHAQLMAEKMVEENLVEFGNMIRDEPNGEIPALAEYFMRTINLKSRER